MSTFKQWGSTSEERAQPMPCDLLVEHANAVYNRALDVAAPAPLVYRWLCQLRVAPYSYDLIDNFGRRSPRRLTPGVDSLAVGQKILVGFRVANFTPERSITLISDARHERVFGRMSATYAASPLTETSCRLRSRVVARYPGGLHGRLLMWLLPLGDFLMMRKQFLTFKSLAERGWRDQQHAVAEQTQAPQQS